MTAASSQHAIISRKVLSHDSGDWLLCCWDDCQRQGYDMHKAIQRTTSKASGRLETVSYVFCTERHRQFFLNSHRRYGFTA